MAQVCRLELKYSPAVDKDKKIPALVKLAFLRINLRIINLKMCYTCTAIFQGLHKFLRKNISELKMK